MGAALHLAHAHQLPPAPKRKRKGGGSDDDWFAKTAGQIYEDIRVGPESRELLLAVAYAIWTVDPDDGPAQWAEIRRVLGCTRTQRNRVDDLVAQDAPRYMSPRLLRDWNDPMRERCSAPRLRPFRSHPMVWMTEKNIAELHSRDDQDLRNKLMVCGDAARDYAVEKLPGTGWHKHHYFCTRHQDHLARIQAQVKAGNEAAPEPIPNVGGLLPCYFDADWEQLYRAYAGERWRVPSYGLRADDWPIPGKEPVPQRARLRLAAVDGELLARGGQ